MKSKPVDKVFIRQLIVPVIIGVLPEERQAPQYVLIDLDMNSDVATAAVQDDLTLTVDYAAARNSILEFAKNTQYQLIETLADRLALHLIEQFNLAWCRLTITKKPFDIPDAEGVGVTIERFKT